MEHRIPSRARQGLQVAVTPEQAGWEHLSFRVVGVDGLHRANFGQEEAVAVLLSGSGTFRVGDLTHRVEGRRDVFSGLPWFAYVPPGTDFEFLSEGPAELAWGSAPAEPGLPARILGPRDCDVEMRGGGNVTRQVTHLIDPGMARRLLCVEVYTPSGNWSSYPPHKHDRDRLPHEVDLDEIYHYRMDEKGFALQRLYDGEDLDEVIVARDRDTVLVRRGYHPVAAAPGYPVYYLNFLAGRNPVWITCDDPDHAWVRETWDSRAPLDLPLEP